MNRWLRSWSTRGVAALAVAAAASAAISVAAVAAVAPAAPPSSVADTQGKPAPDALDRVDELVQAEMKRHQIPGVALAIVQYGQVTKARGYGFANVEHEVPVTPETVFQSGSVGKQFTAAAVMTFVEEGRIGLDDPLKKYLPDTPASWREVTVRGLLTHTAGIVNYTDGAVDLRRDYTEDELVRAAYKLGLDFPPASRWSYSNTGYVLLGALVRKVSGRFYGDVLRERIFEPLGMTSARVISEAEIVPHRAAGYQLKEGALRNQDWVSPSLNTTADGALYLSLLDLVAWDRGLREGRVLSREGWDQVFAPVRLRSGRAYPYGFGWAIEELAGQIVHEHGGSWQGFRSSIARYRGSDVTVIALANLAQGDAGRLGEQVAALLDPKLERPALRPLGRTDAAAEARLRALLAEAVAGRLRAKDFVFASFVPRAGEHYRKLLQPLGSPTSVTLLAEKDLGDDRVTTWDVAFPEKVVRVEMGLAPDGRIATFDADLRAP